MKLVAVAVVLVAMSSAHAEEPVGVILNPSVALTANKVGNSGSRSSKSAVLAMEVDVGYRWSPETMLGVHLGAATPSDQIASNSYSMYTETEVHNYLPIDAGLSVHVGFSGPVYVGAWIGAQRGWRRLECNRRSSMPNEPCRPTDWALEKGASPAFGLSVGWDAFRNCEHRVSITGSLETAIDTVDRPYAYTAIALGVAYRFWK